MFNNNKPVNKLKQYFLLTNNFYGKIYLLNDKYFI